jgi:cold shock CspA family protein
MTDGIIKVKNLAKKFVVIEGADGQEYFVSSKKAAGIKVGDRVDFDEDPDESKGKRAKSLKKYE